jgi:hypothetical protein
MLAPAPAPRMSGDDHGSRILDSAPRGFLGCVRSLPSEPAGLRRESLGAAPWAPWRAWVNARFIPTLVSIDRSPSYVDARAYGPGESGARRVGSFR